MKIMFTASLIGMAASAGFLVHAVLATGERVPGAWAVDALFLAGFAVCVYLNRPKRREK